MKKLQELLKSKWLWIRTFGAVLALAPSIIFLTIMMGTAEESIATPFLQFILISCVALVVGYLFMRKGMAEEERERIRVIVREVIQEQQNKGSGTGKFKIKNSMTRLTSDASDSVVQLPFMEKDDASS